MFYNGQLAFLRIESQEKYVFSEIQESEIVRQAQTMLEGYQTYVRKMYGDDGSYLEPMLNILRSIDYSVPKNTTLGEINLQFLINGDMTRVKWVYCPNGVMMSGKYLVFIREWNF